MPPKRIILDERLYVQVSTIKGAGKGLFALRRIPAGVIIGEYVGDDIHATGLAPLGDDTYFIRAPSFYCLRCKTVHDSRLIDGKTMDNKMRWINDPRYDKARRNAEMRITEVGKVIVVALRSIRPGEEILMTYGEVAHRVIHKIK